MKIEPIHPSIAVTIAENKPLSDDLKARINGYLSNHPWTAYERMNGRWFDCSTVTTHGSSPEAVINAYSKVGWRVKLVDDQRDGAALCFLPPETT